MEGRTRKDKIGRKKINVTCCVQGVWRSEGRRGWSRGKGRHADRWRGSEGQGRMKKYGSGRKKEGLERSG